ncbi:MAG: ABC transporter permease [Chloroflexi bacterium]|nr:ABC transporter permease [Chloroflexota bacterium]
MAVETSTPLFEDPTRTAQRDQGFFRSRFWRRFSANKVGVIGLIIVSILVFLSAAAPLVAPISPGKIDPFVGFQPPSATHWFGTDETGRDIWSRTIYGGRISLFVGLMAVLLRSGIALTLGSLSGYMGGIVDLIVQRIVDILLAFPTFIFLLILVSILGPSIANVFIAIGLLSWPSEARLYRSRVLSLRQMDFVLAARSIGASNVRILRRHIMPNLVGFALVAMTYGIGGAILTEAGISFLGLGVPPPTPSWGNLIQAANTLSVLENFWWMWVAPGIMMIACVLGFNFIGDALRDAFDPHRGR